MERPKVVVDASVLTKWYLAFKEQTVKDDNDAEGYTDPDTT